MNAPARAAAQFEIQGERIDARPWGSGHIHDTYLATAERAGGTARFVLQRLNEAVFPQPERLQENLVRVTAHLRRALARSGVADLDRRCLTLVPARDGRPFHVDAEGRTWRAFHFVEGSRAADRVASPEQAREVARAFGAFAAILSDLPPPPLAVTIPRFHDLSHRFDQLVAALEADRHERAGAVATEAERLARWFETLERGLAECAFDAVPRRIVHHDCKINNVLLDASSGEALCVIDLDTVMEGTVLSDFGELVRTAACRAAEDELNLSAMHLEVELLEALARGYLEGTGGLLGDAELALLPQAGLVLALMNAMRFLTDYVAGDVYFRIARPGHNLERCRAQLRLLELLHEHRDTARRAVEDAARDQV